MTPLSKTQFAEREERFQIAHKFRKDAMRIWIAHTSDGRKITHGWQVRASKELALAAQTLSNYVNGVTPIPQSILLLVQERLERQQG